MGKFLLYWAPVIALCTAIFVQSSFPLHHQLPGFPFADKLMHFIVYAVLGGLVVRGANATDRWRCKSRALFFIGACAAAVYGVSDEWHQSFVVGRNAEAADAMADFFGSMAGSWFWVKILHLRSKSAAIDP